LQYGQLYAINNITIMQKLNTKEIVRNTLTATALVIGVAACSETVTADISTAEPAPQMQVTTESAHQKVTSPPLEYGALVASQNIQDLYKKVPDTNKKTVENPDAITESVSIIRENGLKLYFSETHDSNNNVTNVTIGQSEQDGSANDTRSFKFELTKSERGTWQADCIADSNAATIGDHEIRFTDGSKSQDQEKLAQARGILDRAMGTALGSTLAAPDNPLIPDNLGTATCQQIDALK